MRLTPRSIWTDITLELQSRPTKYGGFVCMHFREPPNRIAGILGSSAATPARCYSVQRHPTAHRSLVLTGISTTAAGRFTPRLRAEAQIIRNFPERAFGPAAPTAHSPSCRNSDGTNRTAGAGSPCWAPSMPIVLSVRRCSSRSNGSTCADTDIGN